MERDRNRAAWEAPSYKHVREYQELLAQASEHSSLVASELDLPRPILAPAPAAVRLQSGNGCSRTPSTTPARSVSCATKPPAEPVYRKRSGPGMG